MRWRLLKAHPGKSRQFSSLSRQDKRGQGSNMATSMVAKKGIGGAFDVAARLGHFPPRIGMVFSASLKRRRAHPEKFLACA